MATETLRYIFWILITLPILFLGMYFFANITNSVYNRYKAESKARKEKQDQAQKRREFEESYSRRKSGGNR